MGANITPSAKQKRNHHGFRVRARNDKKGVIQSPPLDVGGEDSRSLSSSHSPALLYQQHFLMTGKALAVIAPDIEAQNVHATGLMAGLGTIPDKLLVTRFLGGVNK
jgi:hypothetical protein